MRERRALSTSILAILTIVVLVALAGCGDSGPSAVDGAAAPAGTPKNVVPQVEVVDVGTGQRVGLQSRVATDRPTLLWMWAPS